MTARTFPTPASVNEMPGAEEAQVEAFLRDQHDEIEAKLAVAREQIARGEVEEIDPEAFLRSMRSR
ncbi:MAG: hypothetical protein JWP35_4089 [Caulobacter sp.]|nr:hypothetical protein [Caulobacter sp.]